MTFPRKGSGVQAAQAASSHLLSIRAQYPSIPPLRRNSTRGKVSSTQATLWIPGYRRASIAASTRAEASQDRPSTNRKGFEKTTKFAFSGIIMRAFK